MCPFNDSAMRILTSLDSSEITLRAIVVLAVALLRKNQTFDMFKERDDLLQNISEPDLQSQVYLSEINRMLAEGLKTTMDVSKDIFNMSPGVKTRSMHHRGGRRE